MIDLRTALRVMSNSSSYAVSTERLDPADSLQDEIKSYLYIQMPIETAVNKIISSFENSNKKVLFLCGSSGDGKSELLTKAKEHFGFQIKFHLDATHSFDPHGTAIQTLDKVFNEFETTNTPLVVGINAGMLGNYAEEGQNHFIRNKIRAYIENKDVQDDTAIFINFEDYPKFIIDDDGYNCDFAKKLLERITRKENNIFRRILDHEKIKKNDQTTLRLITNFELLSLPSVQKVIIDLLFQARLMREQFLTARSLLDFIHELLSGDGYLFDNLFAGGGNELANKIENFDPSHLRTKELDRFILAYDLGLPDIDFEAFKSGLNKLGTIYFENAAQYLRLFFLLRYDDFANNYHKKFSVDFNDPLIENYISVHQLHKSHNGESNQKNNLKLFYRDTLIAAIRRYINRNAPKLGKKFFLLSDFGDYQIAAPADLTMDYKSISTSTTSSSAFFIAHLKLKDKKFKLPININLLSLLININNGYRPNKHDKNSVVLLEELTSEIIHQAKAATEIVITGIDGKYNLELEEDDIMVSKD
ncbi:DNA phosphorothioation-dependent restriction protein DptF [Psychromonas sp. PT13]|uniref:DNA phosphorothioation-dependent restriction protein DptF n=1 Tax=Psychromonas sp. PT13 TaxID=3439547 RepID=UPI003EBF2569